jgi:DNA-binding NtrC family response regulator
MADGPTIGAEQFTQLAHGESAIGDGAIRTLEQVELEHCKRVLAACGGNKVLAAEKLGISRHTLARKVGDEE